jgi:hypothetical protein
MDIRTFCKLADEIANRQGRWPNDLIERYRLLGLPETGNFTSKAILDELHTRIRSAFVTGDRGVAQQCRELLGELIHDHILERRPLSPYVDILAHIKDATQSQNIMGDNADQSWRQAIESATLSAHEMKLGNVERLPILYPEFYATGYAAARLRHAGYSIERTGHKIHLSEDMQSRLISTIEKLLSEIGGLNFIGQAYNRLNGYDKRQERYHFVAPKLNVQDGQQPLIPIGYLFLLAIKHYSNGQSKGVFEKLNFEACVAMARDYAIILDVQDYAHYPHFPLVPKELIETLQKMALSDSLFKTPQLRGSDVVKIIYGLIDSEALDTHSEENWTLRQAIQVIDAILTWSAERRGPVRIRARDVRKLCPSVEGNLVDTILANVLSHPEVGANQKFSRPTDAPTMTPGDGNDMGADFAQRPLLRYTEKSFMLMDRSACAAAFIESIFSRIRNRNKNFDRKLGTKIERFVRDVLLQHNIPSCGGVYRTGAEEGECDVVVETNDVIIFIEIKKKPLTRRARAGSDFNLVLDLAQSLLDAQVQAGNHEIRLQCNGFLDLNENGQVHRIELKGRSVERIALSFSDFGSFHDRLFLEKILNALVQINFGTPYAQYKKNFEAINELISILRKQNEVLYPADGVQRRPYFNCWFFSLPQLLVLLDKVDGPEAFRGTLWATRNIATGSGDLYFDMHHAEQIKETNSPVWEMISILKDREVTFISGWK